ncbi:MAG: DUF1570 domain-containing protein [Planctomycetes bacterium]|nr:DUF1570 domain-containing protein [Planctomycetota bacterium]MCP4770944.1 DUF1570 domain-containing protein [Planctomycetota bacterium]MCP4861664.1 DUF1570 domain-containing protein [Planctomycetota bacterium]
MLLIALAMTVFQGPPEVPGDLLTTTKGREYSGVLLLETEETIFLGQGSKTKEFKREKVQSITGPRASYGLYVDKLEWVYAQASPSKDAVKLATWCKTNGLMRDAEIHYWQALVKDPENAAAHKALGHRQSGDTWQAPIAGSQWRDMEGLDKWHSQKENPWVFYTAHFNVKANGPLADVLRAVAHLELLYARYYDALQDMGGIFELRQPIQVRIYPDRKSGYAEVSANTFGYFDRESEIINTWLHEKRAVNLVRLTCHALQFRCVTETANARPEDYPGWLNEGIATYFEASFTENEGLSDFFFDRMDSNWMRVHHEAKEPLELDQVLNLRISMADRGDSQLAFAQSYSLFYFLLHNEELPIMSGFKEYLHQVFHGKSSSSIFKKSFKKKTYKELEKKWADFVEKSALRNQMK